MNRLPGTWTYHKPYVNPDPLYEPDILVYYPKGKKTYVMVTRKELEESRGTYADWKVYEGLGENLLVGDWLEREKKNGQ